MTFVIPHTYTPWSIFCLNLVMSSNRKLDKHKPDDEPQSPVQAVVDAGVAVTKSLFRLPFMAFSKTVDAVSSAATWASDLIPDIRIHTPVVKRRRPVPDGTLDVTPIRNNGVVYDDELQEEVITMMPDLPAPQPVTVENIQLLPFYDISMASMSMSTSVLSRHSSPPDDWVMVQDDDKSPSLPRIDVAKEEVLLRRNTFYKSLDDSIRPVVWPVLLDIIPFSSSQSRFDTATGVHRASSPRFHVDDSCHGCSCWRLDINKEMHVAIRERYKELKNMWMSVPPNTTDRRLSSSYISNLDYEISKDVVRTDREFEYYTSDPMHTVALKHALMTFCCQHQSVGYGQGMSDLMSMMMIVLDDEAMAFFCFHRLMQRFLLNFGQSQEGTRKELGLLSELVKHTNPTLHKHIAAQDCLQFYFCFRWLLVLFRREFDFQETLVLWDAIFSLYRTPYYHLLMAAAILDEQSPLLTRPFMTFDLILAHCNALSFKIPVRMMMAKADVLYLDLKRQYDDGTLPVELRCIVEGGYSQ